jgi:SAM-dependent methyltransferase
MIFNWKSKIKKTNKSNATLQSEPKLIAEGWDNYAKKWQPKQFSVLEGTSVTYLGDEWSVENVAENHSTTYGLEEEVVRQFDIFLKEKIIEPYIHPNTESGIEIGSGGGRLTNLLIDRTKKLHVADASENMLAHLKKRFANKNNIEYHLTDGFSLPSLNGLEYAIAFDVFVHFEPRLVFWYLSQIRQLLKPKGIGIIHYANMLTDIGWQQFERDVKPNLHQRTYFAAFGVMCPPIMEKFLEKLDFEIISADLQIVPRDAVAVFRKKL